MTKLTDMLDRHRKAEAITLRVGILDAKTYPDGASVAMVGYVNEYGYKGIVPARRQTIYQSVDKNGEFKNGGKFVKAASANFAREVVVPAHEVEIPSRPFFRTAVAENKQEMMEIIAKGIMEGDYRKGLALAGEFMADKMQESVMTWSDPANAKSTIAKKGYNAPLRGEDKILRNSFSYEFE